MEDCGGKGRKFEQKKIRVNAKKIREGLTVCHFGGELKDRHVPKPGAATKQKHLGELMNENENAFS